MNIIYAKTTLLYRSEPTEDVTYCIWADMLFWVCLPNFKCWPTSHCFTLGSTGTLSLVEALLESTLLSSPHYSTHSYGHPEWLWLSAGGPTGCLIIGTELGDRSVGLLNWIQQKSWKSASPEIQGKAHTGNALSEANSSCSPFQAPVVSQWFSRENSLSGEHSMGELEFQTEKLNACG